jgi:hypothetical protein
MRPVRNRPTLQARAPRWLILFHQTPSWWQKIPGWLSGLVVRRAPYGRQSGGGATIGHRPGREYEERFTGPQGDHREGRGKRPHSQILHSNSVAEPMYTIRSPRPKVGSPPQGTGGHARPPYLRRFPLAPQRISVPAALGADGPSLGCHDAHGQEVAHSRGAVAQLADVVRTPTIGYAALGDTACMAHP